MKDWTTLLAFSGEATKLWRCSQYDLFSKQDEESNLVTVVLTHIIYLHRWGPRKAFVLQYKILKGNFPLQLVQWNFPLQFVRYRNWHLYDQVSNYEVCSSIRWGLRKYWNGIFHHNLFIWCLFVQCSLQFFSQTSVWLKMSAQKIF